MKKIDIKIRRLEVLDHLLKKDIVKVKVDYSYEDVKDAVGVNLKINSKEKMAGFVLKLIREHEKEKNYVEKDDLIEDILMVNFVDYENVLERLVEFFGKVVSCVKNVKSTKFADGYLNTLNAVKGIKLDL